MPETNTLEQMEPDKACFFMDIYKEAEATLNTSGYVRVCSIEEQDEDDTARLLNLEMVRLGFEFGRMYERLGVVV